MSDLHVARSSVLYRPFRRISETLGGLASRVGVFDPAVESDFVQIYAKCRRYTLTSWERMYALYKSVKYILEAEIEGDFVECGVWKGGSVMLIAYTLVASKSANRKLFLYDTFTGMSKPAEMDVDLASHEAAEAKWKITTQRSGEGWTQASLSEVSRNVYSTGYPTANLIFVQGKVEETLLTTIPDKICLLRLDTDWYASTKQELIHLYPRLSSGGVLIVDDYGHWLGAKKAVDEYLSSCQHPLLLSRIDYSGRIGVKPGC